MVGRGGRRGWLTTIAVEYQGGVGRGRYEVPEVVGSETRCGSSGDGCLDAWLLVDEDLFVVRRG